MPSAWVCRKLGPFAQAMAIDERPPLEASGGMAVVDVLTCGIDFVQTLLVEGKYQIKPPPGFTPGTEIVGIVKEVGSGVSAVKAGDVVMLATLMGGMQEEMLIDPQSAVVLPRGCNPLLAPSLYAYGTALFALRGRAKVQPGESVLVLGAAGAIGSAAVEVAKMLGADKVVAAVSSDAKAALCRELGAGATINYAQMTPQEFREALQKEFGKKGVDVIYDPIGGEFAQPAARALAYGGRYVSLGFASGGSDAVGAIPRLPANLFLLKNAQLLGSGLREFQVHDPMAAAAMNAEIVELWHSGKLKPKPPAAYVFDQLPQAYTDLRARKVVGRAVLTTDRFQRGVSKL